MICLDNIENFCERVRTMLGYDESIVPDNVILRYEYSGVAKKYVDDRLKPYNFETLTDEQYELLNCCYIVRTAIEVLPTISAENNVKLEQTTHSKTEYFKNGNDDLLEKLSEKFSYFFNLLTLDESTYSVSAFRITNETERYEGMNYHI